MSQFKKINPKLIEELVTGKHSLAGNPSIPDDLLEDNEFLVKIFAKRFNSIYNEGKRVTKKDDITSKDIINSSYRLVELVNKVELQHKNELEALAEEIVTKEFDVDPEFVELRFKLIDDFPSLDHVRKTPTNKVSLNIQTKEDVKRIKNEVHKRRMLNAIMQGMSNRFNHIFHMYRDNFNAMDKRLMDAYQKVMATAELAYFMMPLETKRSGGFCSVTVPKNEGDKYIVSIEAMTFPLLVHEGIKGVLEVISMNGLPENEEEIKYVFEKADYYEAESWDMILGVGIWDAINSLLDVEGFALKHHVFYELAILPVDQFHDTMQEILSGSEKGKKILTKIVDNIKKDIAHDKEIDSLFNSDDSFDDFNFI